MLGRMDVDDLRAVTIGELRPLTGKLELADYDLRAGARRAPRRCALVMTSPVRLMERRSGLRARLARRGSMRYAMTPGVFPCSRH